MANDSVIRLHERDVSAPEASPAGTLEIAADEVAHVPGWIDDAGVFHPVAGTVHSHAGEDITSGTVAEARVASTLARDSEVIAYAQPLDADLTAIAALVSAADKLPYATGAGTWALTDLSAFIRTLLNDADAAAARATLGVAADADVSAHLGDTTDAHDASAISIADAGGWFAATDVEAALQELPTLLDVVVPFVIDGGGSEITTGIKAGDIRIPFDCQIVAWTLLADQTGDIVIDVWKDTYANYPPTNADAMPGAGKEPTISGGVKAEDTNITDWTTDDLAAGDTLRFNVDSVTDITYVTLNLVLRRT